MTALIFFFCINMKHQLWAQTSTPLPSGLPVSNLNVAPPTQPTSPAASPNSSGNSNANTDKKDSVPVVKKYAERKSICIDLEKEGLEIKSEKIKKNRLDFKKKKIEPVNL